MKTAKLGTALKLHVDAVPVDTNATYPMSGVYSYGRGLIKREPLSGANTSYKKFHRLHTTDFVLSQLKGWEGAIALVTDEFDGYFLSPQFPTFRAIPEKLDIHYLDWYCKQPSVWAELLANARGMGARRSSVSPKQFLALEIPLPPLDEQRRIVARIEALAGRVAEAQRLRVEVREQAYQMLLNVYYDLVADVKYKPMKRVAPIVRRPVEVQIDEDYHELGIRSFGRGTFHKPPIKGIDLGSKRIFWIKPGDLLFSNVFSWEGAIAVVKPEDEGRVGSHRFISCVPKQGVATSSFLCFHFLTPRGLEDIGAASPGGAGRNRTLGLKKLEMIEVPLPTYEKQLWFDSLIAKVDTILTTQSENQAELDALLPAILDKAFRGEL